MRREWTATIDALPFACDLKPEVRGRLETQVRLFIDRVYWEGRSGLEVTDEMRVSVAAQACRLTLNLPEDAYRRVQTIYLFPATYRVGGGMSGSGGVRGGSDSHRHGEAWLRGPVVLSWDATQHGVARPNDGRNVVYHEFAHKLDMLDGYADGVPPTRHRAAFDQWTATTQREYAELVEASRSGKKTLLDPYGATNQAEFFAVSTEMFFERPRRLRERHPELYACLAQFYLQDPLE